MEINAGLLDKTPPATLKQSACPEKDLRTGLVWLAAFFKESGPIRIAFNLLYLYFGMVTTEQMEGKCVEHVLSDS